MKLYAKAVVYVLVVWGALAAAFGAVWLLSRIGPWVIPALLLLCGFAYAVTFAAMMLDD